MAKPVLSFQERRAEWLGQSEGYGYKLRPDQRIPGTKCPHTELMYLRMSWREFRELPEYSTSLPTGTYAGKRWRKDKGNGLWIVGEYGDLAKDDTVEIRWARPLIKPPAGGFTKEDMRVLRGFQREFTADELESIRLRRLQMRERLTRPQAHMLHSMIVQEPLGKEHGALALRDRVVPTMHKFRARMAALGVHEDVYRFTVDRQKWVLKATFHNQDDRDLALLGMENRMRAVGG